MTSQGILSGYLLLFAALYGGYGALSPFLPGFLQDRGLLPDEIAWLLALAMLVRLVAGPLIGRLTDRVGQGRTILALCLASASVGTAAILSGHGFPELLALTAIQAIATAPLAPLADALALTAASGGRTFQYGWVRAAGSSAFIAATTVTGYIVEWKGTIGALCASAFLFVVAAMIAACVVRAPQRDSSSPGSSPGTAYEPTREAETIFSGFRELVAIIRFRRLVLCAALVIGAHAMHDAFAVIVWREAGITAGTAGLLWSESVAAEIMVFLWLGPILVRRFGSSRTIQLAALAGSIRWAVQAETLWPPAMIAIQSLHGLTFAALHLACLAEIEACVPDRLRATALTIYGSVALGLATALLTLAAGNLYGSLGTHAFWAMSALSLAAVPLASALRRAS